VCDNSGTLQLLPPSLYNASGAFGRVSSNVDVSDLAYEAYSFSPNLGLANCFVVSRAISPTGNRLLCPNIRMNRC